MAAGAFFKTRLCKFSGRGRCKYGRQCPFAHDDDEIRQLPGLAKTRLCDSVLQGRPCMEGRACNFAHSSAELRGIGPADTRRGAPAARRAAPQPSARQRGPAGQHGLAPSHPGGVAGSAQQPWHAYRGSHRERLALSSDGPAPALQPAVQAESRQQQQQQRHHQAARWGQDLVLKGGAEPRLEVPVAKQHERQWWHVQEWEKPQVRQHGEVRRQRRHNGIASSEAALPRQPGAVVASVDPREHSYGDKEGTRQEALAEAALRQTQPQLEQHRSQRRGPKAEQHERSSAEDASSPSSTSVDGGVAAHGVGGQQRTPSFSPPGRRASWTAHRQHRIAAPTRTESVVEQEDGEETQVPCRFVVQNSFFALVPCDASMPRQRSRSVP